MRVLLCFILMNGSFLLVAQEHAVYSKDQLLEDFQYLMSRIDKSYSDKHSHFFQPDIQLLGDRYLEEVQEGMTQEEFFRLLSGFLAHTGERHVRLGYAKWDPLVKGGLSWRQKQVPLLPFELRYVQGRAYVWENYSDDLSISKGAEILSINGKPIEQITAQLMNYVISDGEILGSKYHDLSRRFRQYYFFYIGSSDQYEIQYMPRGLQAVQTCLLAGQTEATIRNRKTSRYAFWQQRPGEEEVYSLSLLEKAQTAVLQIRTFELRRYKQHRLNFRQLFQNIFSRLADQRIRHLIVDLRGNPGGSMNCMFELFSYFIREYYSGAIKQSISRGGRENAYQFPRPKPEAFKGQLYLLTDGATFSAASELAVYAKNYASALLIGEETAGRYEGYAAGYTYHFRLPHSGIRIWLPGIQYEFIVDPPSEKDRGLFPDYEISPSIADLMEGRDVALQFALTLAQASLDK